MPKKKKIPFWKQKTTWAAIGTALAAGAGWATGEVEPYTGMMGILASFMGLFMRQGIEKAKGE